MPLASVVTAALPHPRVQSQQVVGIPVRAVAPASGTTPAGAGPTPVITAALDSAEPHPDNGIVACSDSEDSPTMDRSDDDGERGFSDGGDWTMMDEIESTAGRADIEAAGMDLGVLGITPQIVELTLDYQPPDPVDIGMPAAHEQPFPGTVRHTHL